MSTLSRACHWRIMPPPVARALGDHPTGVSRVEEVHFLCNAMAAEELQRVSVLTELSDRGEWICLSSFLSPSATEQCTDSRVAVRGQTAVEDEDTQALMSLT